MRKLATVEKIIDIQPIPGADAIEVATVRGWKVVIKKSEFNVGDLVVYCEVDSWIPTALAPFLSKGKEPKEFNDVKGERLRTVKLRGQISQGLILPMPDGIASYIIKTYGAGMGATFEQYAGYDVSECLGIQKYEPPVPACLSGVVKGAWPSVIPKTDQERIQNLTTEYVELRRHRFEVTEKLEGSSCTMAIIDDEFCVMSRNLNLRETDDNTFWKMARKYDVENHLRNMTMMHIAIQGEVIGEGVQGNHYGIKGQEFYVFDMFDIASGSYISPSMRRSITDALGLKHAPYIDTFPLSTIECLGMNDIESVLQYADGKSMLNPNKPREGVVFKRVDGQDHFKAVSNKYLLSTN